MPQRLANGHTKLFQFLAGCEVLFPSIGELVNPRLLENILAIRVRATAKEYGTPRTTPSAVTASLMNG